MKQSLSLLIILMLVLSNSAFCQTIRSLFYDEVLYGKVKTIYDDHYLPGSSIVEVRDTTWYDEIGNTKEDSRRTMHGTLFNEKYSYTIDASGKKIQIVGSENNQNLKATLDLQGHVVEYDSHLKNGSLNFYAVYSYNDKGDLASFASYSNKRQVTQKRTYQYDKDDKLINEDVWKGENTLDYHLSFEYPSLDAHGNWLKRVGHRKSSIGVALPDLVVLRRIVYYP
jgi:hypothetical protein